MTEKPLKKELQLVSPEVKEDILHIKQKQDNGQKQKKKQLLGTKIYDRNNLIDCSNNKSG